MKRLADNPIPLAVIAAALVGFAPAAMGAEAGDEAVNAGKYVSIIAGC